MFGETEIKVLIVDDSKVSRDLMIFIIQSDPRIKVIGQAENGEEALKIIEKTPPDVIMTDVVMPVMDGFEFTRRVMEKYPTPIIIVSGVYNREEMRQSFRVLEAGALAMIEKPKGMGDKHYKDVARFVIETIKIMSEVKLMSGHNILHKQLPSTHAAKESPSSPTTHSQNVRRNYDIVVIGSSIGGPQALEKILLHINSDFPVPILIVQHMSSAFMEGFVQWLNETTKLKVSLAKDNEKALPGHVYVAPDKFNMEIEEGNIIRLTQPADQNKLALPTIGSLFKSVSKKIGARSIGVLLTGVGKDGAQELLEMKNAGAYTIAQDEDTSIRFDLPKKAISLNAVTQVLPIMQISDKLQTLMEKNSHDR